MKQFSIALTLLGVMCAPGMSWAYTIAWDAVTTNADGTPITDLAGYRLYACNGNVPSCSRSTPGVQGAGSALITSTFYTPTDQATLKTWFVTAVDATGNESLESLVVVGPPQDTKPPNRPSNVRIEVR